MGRMLINKRATARRAMLRTVSAFALAGAALSPVTASAQTALEEIVVTALKGDVSVQDAPTTVNVLSGEDIAKQVVTSVEQLTAVLPGVRVNQAPGGTINPVVRGLGSSPSNNSFEQTVGLFVDGIFAGHPRDYSNAIFDLERVELLKGTQAAVVGKNTSVGAISLITKKPSFEFGGQASYAHEFEFGSDVANIAVNVPLNDQFAVRVAGMLSEETGWVRNVHTGGDEPSTKRAGVRATLLFAPNEGFDWTVSAQYSTAELEGQYFHFGLDTLGNARASAIRAGDVGFNIRRYESRWSPRPGFVPYRGFTTPGSETTGSRFTSTINYDVARGTVTATTGYSQYEDTFLIDGATLFRIPAARGGNEKDSTFSQEVRYASDWDGRFNLITGVYYYYDKWRYEDLFDFDASALTTPLSGRAIGNYTQTTRTASAFGQGTFDVTEQFKVTAGVRYEHFEKEGDYGARRTLTPGALTTAVYGPYAPFRRSGDKDYVDYSLQAQYFWNPNLNLYVSYATGTKGFGFVASPTAPGGVVTEPFYKTEQSQTWEAGMKATLDRGNINLAVFNTELEDYQIGVNLGVNFLIRNDQIRSRGAELSADWELFEGLRGTVVATYADVEKQDPRPANSVPGLPFAPKWSGIASLTYTRDITDDLTFTGDLTGEFRSKSYLSDLANFVYPQSKGRVITDLRLGVASERTGVELALIGRNIFDEYSVNYAYNSFGTPGGVQISEDRPRTIAVQVSLDF